MLGVLGLGLKVGWDMLIVIEHTRVMISARQEKKKRQ
jgi:hypothetical protein